MELACFDTQLMQNAEISGLAYQQGALAGYEVREYLLAKWGRTCAYCGKTDTAGGRASGSERTRRLRPREQPDNCLPRL